MVYEYDRLTETTCAIISECYYEPDAEFIAAAREDIPKLLAEVEALNTEIADRERSHIDMYCDNKELAAEVARLRKALEYFADDVNYPMDKVEIYYAEELSDIARKALNGGD